MSDPNKPKRRKIYNIWEAYEQLGLDKRKGYQRSYMWIEHEKGPIKMIKPKLSDNFMDIECQIQVMPRYQVTIQAL